MYSTIHTHKHANTQTHKHKADEGAEFQVIKSFSDTIWNVGNPTTRASKLDHSNNAENFTMYGKRGGTEEISLPYSSWIFPSAFPQAFCIMTMVFPQRWKISQTQTIQHMQYMYVQYWDAIGSLWRSKDAIM